MHLSIKKICILQGKHGVSALLEAGKSLHRGSEACQLSLFLVGQPRASARFNFPVNMLRAQLWLSLVSPLA